MKNNGVIN